MKWRANRSLQRPGGWIFHIFWTYMVKDLNAQKKARMACDGSPRGGKARILDYTHANCIDHTASRLFYVISAAENLLIYGDDVSNAFSETLSPKQGFYILPDRAFNEWWEAKGLPLHYFQVKSYPS
jgi:hypothetical protein